MNRKNTEPEVPTPLAVPICLYGLVVSGMVVYLAVSNPKQPIARVYLPDQPLVQGQVAVRLCDTPAKLNVAQEVRVSTKRFDCI